ncbi:MAG: 16S rRNA (cytosine(967)-C(5))-methyltransferase RsmB [Burkholderiaceae bacterium]|jgi:16S rRNA (cytosine967-C5)-methyltransferase|nr:16S rRNA (cytosine(967)-C(5))-methyltransferase RsmB [Burkholderiaceae bacterium]
MNGASPPLADALRVAAAAWRGLRDGNSLDRALDRATRDFAAGATTQSHPRLAAAAKDIAYGATRQLALIEAMLARLAHRAPEPEVAALLAVTLGQLLAPRHAAYVVVDQAVQAAKAAPATLAAAGFVNAVLRNALRRLPELRPELERQPKVAFNAPRWWIDRLREAEPAHFARIAQLQQKEPPLVLRVNRRRGGVEAYLRRLRDEGVEASRVGLDAVRLHAPLPVADIPGFAAGDVSVQDAGAQLAALLLQPEHGMTVLDACAAPGGKTAQLAELADDLVIDAVEIDPARAVRIEENLQRTQARRQALIRVHVADATRPERFAPAGRGYQRILLDAPCTASGIVRRHPDIPWLRRPSDVAQLATLQRRLLDALWPLLEPAGRLLYVVCSVFAEEGPHQAAAFAARHADARPLPLAGASGGQLRLLPAHEATWSGGLPSVHDGFFFAVFEKT